eukprot:gene43365-biopygen36834
MVTPVANMPSALRNSREEKLGGSARAGRGKGLFTKASNRVIRQLRAELGAQFPIIGVGGVMSASDAVSKIEAGADVVQIYTGLIYEGPGLVSAAAAAIKAAAVHR